MAKCYPPILGVDIDGKFATSFEMERKYHRIVYKLTRRNGSNDRNNAPFCQNYSNFNEQKGSMRPACGWNRTWEYEDSEICQR